MWKLLGQIGRIIRELCVKIAILFCLWWTTSGTQFVTIYGTIFLFLELRVPLQEKKTAVINHSCQYKCRSFEPGMEKKSRCVVFMTIPSLDLSKKEGQTKILIFYPYFSVTSSQKKRIRNPTQTQYINFQNRGRSPKNIRYHRLRSSMPVTENSSMVFSFSHLQLAIFR